uniref:Uncharacterized protein n=1 Tax=Oscillatoriales cyanobacterium SpSt-418 TaxID=2282169 RepID=A0A7C3KGB7_9CYAN
MGEWGICRRGGVGEWGRGGVGEWGVGSGEWGVRASEEGEWDGDADEGMMKSWSNGRSRHLLSSRVGCCRGRLMTRKPAHREATLSLATTCSRFRFMGRQRVG